MRATVGAAEGWALVGKVGVDSGHIIIGDANYVGEMMNDWQKGVAPEGGYEAFFKARGTTPETAQVYYGLCEGLLSVSGHGDGVYPVYARHEKGYLAELRIDFRIPER